MIEKEIVRVDLLQNDIWQFNLTCKLSAGIHQGKHEEVLGKSKEKYMRK